MTKRHRHLWQGRYIGLNREQSLYDRLGAQTAFCPITGCWWWAGNDTDKGYGRIGVDRKHKLAHRISYERHKGQIPEGLQLDHLCRNRLCINPEHLEPVTIRENLMRGVGLSAQNAVKTSCPRGHLYTENNTRLQKRRNGFLVASNRRKAL